ncbi:hypothetical protein AKJ09_07106 [Labilithrix luteola]|uniref:Uncharacterized protein n=1 Tax=Labilithrix luteola TaxID=1391654 RepID=A0A0K1Q3W6_9BACT|nr:hypothetical protein [Labilithrix luteola]AKV00443.1 hypothetical protein AKJ09_07106 [Labilithrix luteola]
MSRDPIRLSELRDPPSADAEFLGTVLRTARRASPPLGKMDELASRLGPMLGDKPPSPVRWMPWASASVVAIALVTATVVVTRSNSGAAVAPTTTTTTVRTERPEPAPERAAAPVEAAPAISVDSLPDVHTQRVPVPASAPATSLARCNEVELIDAADTKLRAGDAAGALAMTREHEQRCASGTLAQERERIAIEALAKLGRNDAARARAHAFEERYPSSPHVRRVRQVIGDLNR